MSMLTSDLSTAIPELSLTKCQNYDIAKDSFTEIVLLTVISYFCVSTEQRFINMNNEKERNQQSIMEKSSRSILNNSNQSMLQSMKSSFAGGAQSAHQRSTKTQSGATSQKLAGSKSNTAKNIRESFNSVTDKQAAEDQFNSEQQEYFLAKALHFGILYLPPESPLVQHLT